MVDYLYHGWWPFFAELFDDSTTDDFEDDEPLGDGNAATKTIVVRPSWSKVIHVQMITYYLNPTNAVTPTVYLLADNEAGATHELRDVIWQSAAALVDSQLYIDTGATTKLPTTRRLETISTIYMKIDWTGAPGNTTGFVRVEGLGYV